MATGYAQLNKWGSQNLVSFNPNKTQCCLISRKKNKNKKSKKSIYSKYLFTFLS